MHSTNGASPTLAAESVERLALQYAAGGWNVFPIHGIVDGRCTCGNADPDHAGGKHPATRNGLLDATTDPAIVRSWWQAMPDANVAIRCGAASGLVVLDVDPAHGGDDSLRVLVAKHGPLPATLEAATGGGGRHLFFRHPGRPVRSSAGTLGSGLDVRADGGYVVGPPSLHASGRRYAWLGAGRLAAAPEWILEPPAKNGHRPAAAIPETISAGQRNATLFSLAGSMRHRGMTVDEIEVALTAVNERCGPPLPADEVRRMAESTGRYAPAAGLGGAPHGGMADGDPPMADGGPRTRPDSDPVETDHGGMADVSPRTEGAAGGGLGGSTAPLADTLDAVHDVLARFVVLTPAQLDAIVLWAAHTHAFDAADATPYLAISSPEKRSGKTRLLEVLDGLVARPWLTGRTSAAALYRKIDKQEPTLLLDESDAAFNGDKEYAEALRGILNTGHRRGGCASVCVGQGAGLDVKDFSTFCAKAIAGIGGNLPDTVADRAIPIVMHRRAPDEDVAHFRFREVRATTQPLHDALAAWAVDAVAPLTDARPETPTALDDRAADCWEPLVAIADLAGGEWPLRARDAAVVLSTGGSRDDESDGVRLLADIRLVFVEGETDRIPSADLVTALVANEEAPWGAWGKNERPLTARVLARLLRRYGIRPSTIWLGIGRTPKGYKRADLDDAWARYLPQPPTSAMPPCTAQTGVERAPGGQITSAMPPPTSAMPPCDGPEGAVDAAEAARIAACRAFE
ncbi:MAG: DUF3631 domain-containing protein [Actinomycetota bacterium]|nr:DUF3631 domain-containing protein [Actinomycetota bacterium]